MNKKIFFPNTRKYILNFKHVKEEKSSSIYAHIRINIFCTTSRKFKICEFFLNFISEKEHIYSKQNKSCTKI